MWLLVTRITVDRRAAKSNPENSPTLLSTKKYDNTLGTSEILLTGRSLQEWAWNSTETWVLYSARKASSQREGWLWTDGKQDISGRSPLGTACIRKPSGWRLWRWFLMSVIPIRFCTPDMACKWQYSFKGYLEYERPVFLHWLLHYVRLKLKLKLRMAQMSTICCHDSILRCCILSRSLFEKVVLAMQWASQHIKV